MTKRHYNPIKKRQKTPFIKIFNNLKFRSLQLHLVMRILSIDLTKIKFSTHRFQ
jgi:hypothetical protein